MIRVLFVCLGNICRSPIAEGVFRELVRGYGLQGEIVCDSAGTAAYHAGSLPDKRMRKVASKNGITLTHPARQFSSLDFSGFNYIMAMDEANFENVQREAFRIRGSASLDGQLFLYRMFDPLRRDSVIVPDPYFESDSAFVEVYEIVTRSGIAFLNFLIGKHNLIVKATE